MRRRSKKRQQLIDEFAEVRHEFKIEMGGCAVCGDSYLYSSRWPSILEVHEIVGGGMRGTTYADRRAWLCLCSWHHLEFQDRGQTPYAKQYAYKQKSDPEWYDRRWLNSLIGDSECITEEDVKAVKT